MPKRIEGQRLREALEKTRSCARMRLGEGTAPGAQVGLVFPLASLGSTWPRQTVTVSHPRWVNSTHTLGVERLQATRRSQRSERQAPMHPNIEAEVKQVSIQHSRRPLEFGRPASLVRIC